MADSNIHGRAADAPQDIPAKGWWSIFLRVKDEISSDHVSVVAAGVAFFGLLAMFPAVAALISIAGFVLDPSDVASQLTSLVSLLPENAASIIQDQIMEVTGGSETGISLTALFGILLALYGATKGMMTLMEGINIAYDEKETRGIVKLYLTGLCLTLFLILGLLVAFGVVIFLPIVLNFVPLPGWVAQAMAWLKWPLLALFTVFGLAVIYRFGPARANAKWRWISPGAFVATLFWLLGTIGFSIYTQNFASYNETYGTLGGVIVLLTWLWLSAFIVLFGAELNSEMEHQTQMDSTTGPREPKGERGAIKADTNPAPRETAQGVSSGDDPEREARGDVPPNARPHQRDTRRRHPALVTMLGLFALWRVLNARAKTTHPEQSRQH